MSFHSGRWCISVTLANIRLCGICCQHLAAKRDCLYHSSWRALWISSDGREVEQIARGIATSTVRKERSGPFTPRGQLANETVWPAAAPFQSSWLRMPTLHNNGNTYNLTYSSGVSAVSFAARLRSLSVPAAEPRQAPAVSVSRSGAPSVVGCDHHMQIAVLLNLNKPPITLATCHCQQLPSCACVKKVRPPRHSVLCLYPPARLASRD